MDELELKLNLVMFARCRALAVLERCLRIGGKLRATISG